MTHRVFITQERQTDKKTSRNMEPPIVHVVGMWIELTKIYLICWLVGIPDILQLSKTMVSLKPEADSSPRSCSPSFGVFQTGSDEDKGTEP